jgi:ubiquinone/menaquinone biosynthesis C-methylase UbiE
LSDKTDKILPFTGERFTPECVREIAYEHWHRYAFAIPFAKGKRVLDAACGEGYGSALLARHAEKIYGVDLDHQTISHAQEKYKDINNLEFIQASILSLQKFKDKSFDLIVSYETLEHLYEHEELLREFSRLIKDDGLLLISTPDKKNYSDETGHANEFHVRELYRDEFEALLKYEFAFHKLFGQCLLQHSVLWDTAYNPEKTKSVWQSFTDPGLSPMLGLNYAPIYYVAVCAKQQELLAGLPELSLYADQEQSIQKNYAVVYRDLQLWAERSRNQEKEIEELKARLAYFEGMHDGE